MIKPIIRLSLRTIKIFKGTIKKFYSVKMDKNESYIGMKEVIEKDSNIVGIQGDSKNQIDTLTFKFGNIVFINDARKFFLSKDSTVNWGKVQERWDYLKNIQVSLGNKFFTHEVHLKAKSLPNQDQHRLLNVMMSGLCNNHSTIGVYATRLQDYDAFSFYLGPLIRAYHQIECNTKQMHDWSISIGKYLLKNISSDLNNVSMRARVARNVKGWNLPTSMDKQERIKFQATMEQVFCKFDIPGKYHSLTPGHKNQLKDEQAEKMRVNHFLFNDMTTDNYLTSSGSANDWPHGRGIWISDDNTKMIWVGEQDQLRIISIVYGNDLGVVNASLGNLLNQMEANGAMFSKHPVYGFITTCPTNIGTGMRQSILGKFPNITKKGQHEKALKELAKSFNLQARGVGGENSNIDYHGTADVSPTNRFGITQATAVERLYDGLVKLYSVELGKN